MLEGPKNVCGKARNAIPKHPERKRGGDFHRKDFKIKTF